MRGRRADNRGCRAAAKRSKTERKSGYTNAHPQRQDIRPTHRRGLRGRSAERLVLQSEGHSHGGGHRRERRQDTGRGRADTVLAVEAAPTGLAVTAKALAVGGVVARAAVLTRLGRAELQAVADTAEAVVRELRDGGGLHVRRRELTAVTGVTARARALHTAAQARALAVVLTRRGRALLDGHLTGLALPAQLHGVDARARALPRLGLNVLARVRVREEEAALHGAVRARTARAAVETRRVGGTAHHRGFAVRSGDRGLLLAVLAVERPLALAAPRPHAVVEGHGVRGCRRRVGLGRGLSGHVALAAVLARVVETRVVVVLALVAPEARATRAVRAVDCLHAQAAVLTHHIGGDAGHTARRARALGDERRVATTVVVAQTANVVRAATGRHVVGGAARGHAGGALVRVRVLSAARGTADDGLLTELAAKVRGAHAVALVADVRQVVDARARVHARVRGAERGRVTAQATVEGARARAVGAAARAARRHARAAVATSVGGAERRGSARAGAGARVGARVAVRAGGRVVTETRLLTAVTAVEATAAAVRGGAGARHARAAVLTRAVRRRAVRHRAVVRHVGEEAALARGAAQGAGRALTRVAVGERRRGRALARARAAVGAEVAVTAAVMEEGQLVEMGTHDELINLGGLYAELLKCEEATKLPRRMPVRNYKESAVFEVERDSSAGCGVQEPSSPKMIKSPSLQRGSGVFRPQELCFDTEESPKAHSPASEKTGEDGMSLDCADKEPTIKRQDSFEMRLPHLPKVDVQCPQQKSNGSEPESPVSPLLTSDPKNERSHSQTFSRPLSSPDDTKANGKASKDAQHKESPSFWRLAQLSFPEWLYAVLGSLGAAIFGSFNPLLAYVIALVVTEYYKSKGGHLREEVDKWCLIIACMGIVTVVANFLQHFYFGIMGEKMTERVRRMMFSAMLRNEVGWFDDEENSPDTLSMRLANDATFVRAAFSNRLSIFIQDSFAVIVALLIGLLLGWRLALVALATLPILTLSAIAQKLWLAGFSKGIQEMHRKASLVLEDAVRNIYTVVAFCAGNKVMELYRMQLQRILRQSYLHGMAIGFAFGFSQFLLFACNALLLWCTALSVNRGYMKLSTAITEYMVFSFATFALVEPFGLAPYILKRRKSLISVFEIVDRVPTIEPDDNSALKPPNVYGSIELKNVDFCYPTRPEILVLSNFSLKISGGQTVAVVGVSGSGKSTIISLVERYYDPVAGQVLLDGRDLKLYNLRWLRSHMGLVQQEPIIFSTTIRENIIYARHNASEAEMKEAARIANAHHFISSLPHGYDTHIGMRGVELTPGQKQRIAIARVVLKNAPIILIDEASSSIESESSRVVQEALDTLIMGNKTTILIAHRAAMMRHVDNIVVLNGGRIVEEGTHDSLAAKNGLYVRLMQPHFGKGLRQHRLI